MKHIRQASHPAARPCTKNGDIARKRDMFAGCVVLACAGRCQVMEALPSSEQQGSSEMTVHFVSGSVAERRSVAAVVDKARELVEPAYWAVVDVLPPEVRHVAGYHIGWWDADGRGCASSGKSIRPALALACARTVGGDMAAAVPAGVAVELVHDFSLLHDDVMDGDLTPRHRPTVWALFGVGQAILIGGPGCSRNTFGRLGSIRVLVSTGLLPACSRRLPGHYSALSVRLSVGCSCTTGLVRASAVARPSAFASSVDLP